MEIPKVIMRAFDALHHMELSMEQRYSHVAQSLLNQDFKNKLLTAIHDFDLAIVKGVDDFIQSLVHRHNK